MFYWLFTQISAGLACLLPLACCTSLWPVLVAWGMGASIRRTGDIHQHPPSHKFIRGITHLACSTVFSLLYFTLAHDFALRPAPVDAPTIKSKFLLWLAGGPEDGNRAVLLIVGFAWGMGVLMLNIGLQEGLRQGGYIREKVDVFRNPVIKRGAMGSSHFCTMREFGRYRRSDADGMVFYGAFWGERRLRLDWDQGTFFLSGEDIARGILTLGGPGSGKSQGVILPAIADRMYAGHSLIIADPQGELKSHVLNFARVTGHLVVIHDPTSATGPRFNLAEGIATVSDARAIADVLVPTAHGDNKFWSDSAAALLAACLIRFSNLGEIYNALNDLKALAQTLASIKDDAALLANSFNASVGSDGKVASNVIATLATALTGWASTEVRANTEVSDFDADLIIRQPTVVVLTCPGRMRAVYASYLGATLRKLMLDLDTLGEQNGGPLPAPVGVILDEFPTLGKLDSLVADVNLVRKRRISILIGAQTKGQFELIYGREGTQALFTGLATQIVYGGCDVETAEFYSKASGTATADANQDDPQSHLRQRPLLTVDEVITPQRGNCTIFARYVAAGFATQVIFTARLTRLYERRDWNKRLNESKQMEPLLLQRGLKLEPCLSQTSLPKEDFTSEEAAAQIMERQLPNIHVESVSQMSHRFLEKA